jgi:leader peptidase (prepilin peptidase) / N-methyltransferase
MTPLAAYYFMLAFAAAFGGSIGSFMNVVVYRLPNGLSLSRPSSHCPKCKTPICWYDNLPVLGWLKLRGRCRACQCWIPMRYPLVEAAVAAMFVAVVAFQNPLNPSQEISLEVAFLKSIVDLVLLCTLLCAGLMEVDGNRPPVRLFYPALAVGAICSPFLFMTGFITGMMATSLGFGVSIFWAFMAWLAFRRSLVPAIAMICLGLVFGWKAVAAVAFATFIMHYLCSPARFEKIRRSMPPCLWLYFFALVWAIFFFRMS